MSFSNNAFMTLGTDVKDGSARLWSSRKDKDGNYVTDFSDYVQFLGDAAKKAEGLKEKTRIQVKSCAVNNSYNKETGTKYYFKVFDFDVAK